MAGVHSLFNFDRYFLQRLGCVTTIRFPVDGLIDKISKRLPVCRSSEYNSPLLGLHIPSDGLAVVPLDTMETCVHLPETEKLSSIKEVISALQGQGFTPHHDRKDWGDWINLPPHQTVISIESINGMTGSATIEYAEGEDDDLEIPIITAFRELGWFGTDEDGEYRL